MRSKIEHHLLIMLTMLLTASAVYAQADTIPAIRKIDPPVNGFYAKLTYCYGIPIRAAAIVSDSAMFEAYKRMHLMLQNIPAVQRRLVRRGAEMHIIGKDQQPSDLPENLPIKGKKIFTDMPTPMDIDERTRGTGGLYASCGEENLLNLINDRYFSSDICVHEFAHTLMDIGLDSANRNKIRRQYLNAKSKGLWPAAYAISNEHEYWAELSMWYFGTHGEFLKDTQLPTPGSEGLRNYDPEGYQLLNVIYNHGNPITPRAPEVTLAVPVTKYRRTEKKASYASAFTIFNNTAESLNVNWINFDGKPELYAIVKPHSHAMLQTYTGHIWMLADAKHIIGYYQVSGVNCRLDVGE